MQAGGFPMEMRPHDGASAVVVRNGAIGAGTHYGGVPGGLSQGAFPFGCFEGIDGSKDEEEVRLRGASPYCLEEGSRATALLDSHLGVRRNYRKELGRVLGGDFRFGDREANLVLLRGGP